MRHAKLAGALVLVGLVALVSRSAVAHDTGDRAHRFAVADMLALVEQYLDQPEYTNARTAVEENWSQQLQLVEAELQDLLTRREGAVPGSLEQQEINQQGAVAQQRYQQLRQSATMELEQVSTAQAQEAYAKLAEAARTVADREGFDFVLATRDRAEAAEATTVASLAQQMLARPVVVYPEGHDITAAIRAELKIEQPTADEGDDAAE